MNSSAEAMPLSGTAYVRRTADRVAVWAAILLGFSIPVSTTGNGILVGVAAAASLIGGRYRDKLRLAASHPTALLGVALLAVTVLGVLYGTAPFDERVDGVTDYYELLLVPLLMPLLVDQKARRYGLVSLSAALTLILVASYGLVLGIIPVTWWPFGSPELAVPFSNRIDQGVLLAVGAFLFVVWAVNVESPVWRVTLLALAVLAAANVLFVNSGRTGYAVLAALVLFGTTIAARQPWQWLAAVAVVVVVGVAVYHISPLLQQRIDQTVSELAVWQVGTAVPGATAERLLLNHTALAAFLDHPLLGLGPGAFPPLYAEVIADTGLPMHGSVHNEYLQASVQSGILGLGLLVAMMIAQWHEACPMDGCKDRILLRATVVAMAVTCLFNSALVGHTIGHWWAWSTALLLASLHMPRDGVVDLS